jgi:putative endopeptidase
MGRMSLYCCSLLLLSASVCGAQSLALADTPSAPTSIPKKPASFDLTAIDKTADPCNDFFQYACGNWNKANPIPSDQTRWGRFNELIDYNNYLLYVELKAAADAPKTPLQKKYGDYFAACMNTDLVDKLGAKPVQPALDAIAALTSNKQLAAYNAKQQQLRAGGALFGIGVDQDQKDSSKQIAETGQGGLTLPDRDYYIAIDERSQKIREQYVEHMVKMFVLLGDTPEKAAKEAADTMRIETELAKGSMSRKELRDPANTYHMMTVAELQQLTPDYNWRQYLDGMGMSQVKDVNVDSPGYAKTVNTVLETESLDALKSYMRWHTLHRAAVLLSKPFEEENFAFFARTLQGQKEQQPRWKRCTRMTDQALGEAVGQDWVKQNFPPDAKASMEKLVHALETAMAEDLRTLPWMSDATKVEARKKLDAMRNKIGYPEHWRDYSTLSIKHDDLVGNVQRGAVFELHRNLSKYGKPVDETEWDMTPPTVNAYYNPPQNDINFPAGILQPPFFDNAMDPSVNFGGIGVVIGHEMTHGFDDQGAKYDLNGNVKQWWTEEDLAKFKERTECTAKEYDGFTVAPGQNIDGHLTLGENTADNGGIRIAYRALMDTIAKSGPGAGFVDDKKDGYTPQQRFFIGFAQVWCNNQTEQIARQYAKIDPHSSSEWRVKGTVQNFEEFGKAFGCKVGQPMMPVSSCRTW